MEKAIVWLANTRETLKEFPKKQGMTLDYKNPEEWEAKATQAAHSQDQ